MSGKPFPRSTCFWSPICSEISQTHPWKLVAWSVSPKTFAAIPPSEVDFEDTENALKIINGRCKNEGATAMCQSLANMATLSRGTYSNSIDYDKGSKKVEWQAEFKKVSNLWNCHVLPSKMKHLSSTNWHNLTLFWWQDFQCYVCTPNPPDEYYFFACYSFFNFFFKAGAALRLEKGEKRSQRHISFLFFFLRREWGVLFHIHMNMWAALLASKSGQGPPWKMPLLGWKMKVLLLLTSLGAPRAG